MSILVALLASLAFGLQEPGAAPEPQLGEWRAVLECPGGELPFGLSLERGDDGLRARIRNGSEEIEVARATWREGVLELELEPYDSRILARVNDAGEVLVGEWERYSGPDRTTRLSFRARHGNVPRFPRAPLELVARARLDGRWAVDFERDAELSVGIFDTQADGSVEGTFLTTLGDYRYLAGSFDGERLRLSCFDGAHAFLFDAKLGEDGALRGDFWSRDSWHESWTAKKDARAVLPDPFAATQWTGRVPLEELVFPDAQGVRRSLADPEFVGKARIVTLFGTWCPNCNDEAQLLAEFDRRFRERGLRVLGLAFELGDDATRNAERVESFRARHGVEYPILIAGPADKDKASRAFPAIDRLRAYPTAIFIDGAGQVRALHTGFAGPATGAAHERLRERYEALVLEMLEGKRW